MCVVPREGMVIYHHPLHPVTIRETSKFTFPVAVTYAAAVKLGNHVIAAVCQVQSPIVSSMTREGKLNIVQRLQKP